MIIIIGSNYYCYRCANHLLIANMTSFLIWGPRWSWPWAPFLWGAKLSNQTWLSIYACTMLQILFEDLVNTFCALHPLDDLFGIIGPYSSTEVQFWAPILQRYNLLTVRLLYYRWSQSGIWFYVGLSLSLSLFPTYTHTLLLTHIKWNYLIHYYTDILWYH